MMKMSPDIKAVIGIVSSHDSIICLPIDHCTILALSAAPTPMMLDATVWDEDTGAPAMVDIRIAMVELIWELKL
jgi:hypothetical protein